MRLIFALLLLVSSLFAQKMDWTQQIKNKPFIDVREYGAKCDNSTDDTTAFTNAFAAGSTVVVPSGTCVLNSFTISSGKSIMLNAGAKLAPASGQTLTINGSLIAGNYTIFAGSGMLVLRNGMTLSAVWFPGSDIMAQVQAAFNSFGTGCGVVEIPKNDYIFTSTLDLHDKLGCTLRGAGGNTAGSATATRMLYTGNTSPLINAKSTSAFHLSDLSFLASGATFAGVGIDFSHSAGGGDSAFAIVERTAWFSTPLNGSAAKFSIIIDLLDSNSARISDSSFQGAGVAIRGRDGSRTYSNVVTISGNHFSSSTGAVTTAHIQNPGEGWNILNNAFEMGVATGVSKAISCDDSGNTRGVQVFGNWIGDWGDNSSTPATSIEVCGSGWSITGNLISAGAGSGGSYAIDITDATTGVVVQGNHFPQGSANSTAFHIGSDVEEVTIGNNKYEPGQAFLSGTPGSGMVMNDSHVTTLYGSWSINGSVNSGVDATVDVKGTDGNTCHLVFSKGIYQSTTCQ